MNRVSTRLPDDLIDQLDEYENEHDLSRSSAIRELVSSALADERRPDADERLQEVREGLEAEIEELEQEVERQQRERRQLLEQREEHSELVAAVQQEQTLAERKAQAGLGTRIKWWFTGMDDDS